MKGIKERKGEGGDLYGGKIQPFISRDCITSPKRHSGHQSLDWHEEGTFGMRSRIADVSFITAINNVTRNVYEII